ncbi:uncharacterized protein LOC122039737 [Zingiber officinale]|uniref:uncharacterized protein LOC122039737 n=1 Tax=Zingiber officinale TaxID=94328 RepID=UPI001C4D59D3|nr:uncharacterized protein LOC122039737 [Zingiber officinale]
MDNRKAKRKPQGGAAAATGVIIVQVFEEKPAAMPRTSDAALLLRRPAVGDHLLGYDRRQLLLDYTRQLRRIHAEQGSSAAPTWAKWKAGLLHADRRIPMKRNPPSWIHRLWGRIRRQRGEAAAAPSLATAAAKENGKWRRATGMISRLWK